MHEIAHLIMRWEDQFYITIYSDEPCTTYIPSYGRCSEPDAYITDFYSKFWADIYKEWEDSNTSKEFYYQHLDDFVNNYAASNIDEDMAETWSYFVLAPKPTGDTIPEQKVLFYYEYEELVELRQELRNNICTYFDVPFEE